MLSKVVALLTLYGHLYTHLLHVWSYVFAFIFKKMYGNVPMTDHYFDQPANAPLQLLCVPCSAGSSLCYTPQTTRVSSLPDSVAGTPVVRGVVGTPRARGVSVGASPKVGGPSSSGGSVSTRTTKRTRSDDVTLMKSGADTRSSKRSKSESLSGSKKVWNHTSEEGTVWGH